MNKKDYYEGMLDGVNGCCRLMTRLVETITNESNINAKCYVARTAETMAKVADNVSHKISEIKNERKGN